MTLLDERPATDPSQVQLVHLVATGDRVVAVEAPPAEHEVLPGVAWGDINAPMTPAYWKAAATLAPAPGPGGYRVGESLLDEAVVCLLGGFGIKAEVAYAAYHRLKAQGLIDGASSDVGAIEQALREPLNVGGRRIRYRYPAQKARYLANALVRFRNETPPCEGLALREWLLESNGIGPKTASFIVRNWLSCDCVAILDVHVIRAGRHMGLFSERDRVETMYASMERRFLDFAAAIDVRASVLDLLIWSRMREGRFLDALSRLDGGRLAVAA